MDSFHEPHLNGRGWTFVGIKAMDAPTQPIQFFRSCEHESGTKGEAKDVPPPRTEGRTNSEFLSSLADDEGHDAINP